MRIKLCLALCLAVFTASAQTFVLPTPNRAIFTPGAEANYFTPTPSRTWQSGTFGCVRTDGQQLHEGLDIRATKRDRNGEPTDPIYAAAAGRVVYINRASGLSNYGKYLVLQHSIEGMQIFTTYAHLSDFEDGLRVGSSVRQGQTIGTMGRTSNTRSAISKDRAHLHFEIGLRLNDRFSSWHNVALKGQRNDHGNFNGRNFVGLDPWLVFKQQQKLGSRFSLAGLIRDETVLCRVLVRDTKFPFVRDYTPLVRRNPVADREGVAGYEVALNAYGVPFQLIPRARSEIGTGPAVQLLSVNDKEASANPCKKLVAKTGGAWRLTASGTQMFDLLRH
jgi:peptidoglycan LD-endopeptidase LytH